VQQIALINGDLAIGTDGGLLMYSGAPRIKQDLTLALSEEYGSDRFHPTWGSVLTQYLGQVLTAETQQLVRAEVNRVLQNYVIIQQNDVIRDTTVDVQGRYDTSDVVQSIGAITVSQMLDAIYLSATLNTLARQTVTISQQVTA
jgi:phage baseplate assembly protein W